MTSSLAGLAGPVQPASTSRTVYETGSPSGGSSSPQGGEDDEHTSTEPRNTRQVSAGEPAVDHVTTAVPRSRCTTGAAGAERTVASALAVNRVDPAQAAAAGVPASITAVPASTASDVFPAALFVRTPNMVTPSGPRW
ncbi:hypothetical protein [Actinoplanes sp. NPDC049265]|uniref:hypothetical protein n=1 Tax=Actinoplanes sp. NPDC049265 TaxID=3363902 RepID=UPI0037139742